MSHHDDWITLHRGAARPAGSSYGWLATYSGPHAEEIRRLFGTDTLPTGFTSQADGLAVLAELQRLNPDVFVTLAGEWL